MLERYTFLRVFSVLMIVVLGLSCEEGLPPESGPASLINPLVGTASSPQFSHGNTYPAIAMPMGMTAWTPQTGEWGWIYTHDATEIQGLRATHQPSPWMGDYGQFTLMPMVGKLLTEDSERAADFDHSEEIAHPYYYQVKLKEYDILAEVTPDVRAAMLRFTFPEADSAFIVLDASAGMGEVELIPEKQMIRGLTRVNSGGVPDGFACYFVAQFDHVFEQYGTWGDTEISVNTTAKEGDNVGAFIQFATKEGTVVSVKIGTSFISLEQAQQNLDREIGVKNFAQVRATAEDAWNDKLSAIQIEGATPDQEVTFYTAFYRTLIYPRMFHELDKENKPIHYSPYDGQVHPGVMYVDNGFWDTFRAEFPLLSVLFPNTHTEIVRGLIHSYKEGDWFPKWTSPGYRNVMIGTHTASVIADAYAKGMQNFDVETAYEGMVKDALAMPMSGGRGRTGNEFYTEIGYVPDDKVHEATARTLEFAYGDFCVGQLAKALGKKEEATYFFKSAQNFRNVFDPEVGFMRGRHADGTWRPDFSPIEWGGPFTEGSSWHYSWSVMHDPKSLISLMGGEEAFTAKIDELFEMGPDFEVGSYGREIHEMSEMVAGGMGQYAHGNQPVHHLIYLYNYARQPWKTQKWTREVMDKLYGPGPDGLCGDEDNGQMSAWYIFSALGFYPVSPGVPQYVIGSPLFPKATINVSSGRTFVIEAKNNSKDNRYIQSAQLNGKAYNQNWISHKAIVEGGTLLLVMGPEPNPDWGSAPESVPYSQSDDYSWESLKDKEVSAPVFKQTVSKPMLATAALHFRGKLEVPIATDTEGAEIRYTMDGSRPSATSPLYTGPIELTESATIKAIAMKEGMYKSEMAAANYVRVPNEFTLSHSARWHTNYPAGGELALVDGVRGSRNFHDGKWQGFEGTDLEVTIDLQGERPVKELSVGFLQSQGAWIFFPNQVRFLLSENGKDWRSVADFEIVLNQNQQGAQLKQLTQALEDETARYVKIRIQHPKVAPEWHAGAGGNAWLFMDEIEIK